MFKRITITRIDPVQAGKVSMMLHLAIGLLLSFVYGGMGLSMAASNVPNRGLGLVLVAGIAVFVFPIVGFLVGLLFAVVYNVTERIVGGFVLEVEDDSEDDKA